MILVFGDTEARDFPLILFVGREPNDDKPMIKELGKYDFDAPEHNRCTFWNMAYRLVADANGQDDSLTTRELKTKCADSGDSPIAFADISPRPLKSRMLMKTMERQRVSEEEFRAHAEAIIHHTIMKRVKLVLLSGSPADNLERHRDYFESLLDGETGCVRIRFLFPTNCSRNRSLVEADPEVMSIINLIYRGWAR